MRLTIDTNVLVRSLVRDDTAQAQAADQILKSAECIAISLVCLCEVVWVLDRLYGISREDIAQSLRALLKVRNVEVDRAGAEIGLTLYESGADFADGVIAHEGARLGGSTFVSFDRAAAKRLRRAGWTTHELR
jgi:predicted nucleic-acid-binding protein